jgi:hypothetical protein
MIGDHVVEESVIERYEYFGNQMIKKTDDEKRPCD